MQVIKLWVQVEEGPGRGATGGSDRSGQFPLGHLLLFPLLPHAPAPLSPRPILKGSLQRKSHWGLGLPWAINSIKPDKTPSR